MKSVMNKIMSNKRMHHKDVFMIKHFGSDDLIANSLSLRTFPTPRYCYGGRAVLINRIIEDKLIREVGGK